MEPVSEKLAPASVQSDQTPSPTAPAPARSPDVAEREYEGARKIDLDQRA
jgi:hypothetical protein